MYGDYSMVERTNYDTQGRWPPNVVLDETAAGMPQGMSHDSTQTTVPPAESRGLRMRRPLWPRRALQVRVDEATAA